MSKHEAKAQKQVLQEHGVDVLKPSDELMAGLRKAGEKLTQAWLEQTGEAGQSIVDSYRGK